MFDAKKHSGVISEFHKSYIKTGKFEKRFSDVIRQSFTIRNRSDYEDFYVVAKEDVIQQMSNAKEFMAVATVYIDKFVEETGEWRNRE